MYHKHAILPVADHTFDHFIFLTKSGSTCDLKFVLVMGTTTNRVLRVAFQYSQIRKPVVKHFISFMLIDRTHRGWAVFSVLFLLCASLLYAIYAVSWPNG